ncbi:hypothetical protein ABK040_009423 [Willaertia magna]
MSLEIITQYLNSLHSYHFTTEQYLEVLIVVFTNAFILPLIIFCIRNKLPHGVIIGFGTFLTSTLYHTCETLRIKIFDMDAGKYHRLDNVFIILSVQQLFYFLCFPVPPNQFAWRENWVDSVTSNNSIIAAIGLEKEDDYEEGNNNVIKKENRLIRQQLERKRQLLYRESVYYEYLQWSALLFTLLCQEKAPWVEFYTFLPIIVPSLIVLLRRIFLLEKEICPSFKRSHLILGVIFLIIGFICFWKGLDDDNDYLRIWHGCWHVFGGLAFYSFFKSKKEIIVLGEEKKVK